MIAIVCLLGVGFCGFMLGYEMAMRKTLTQLDRLQAMAVRCHQNSSELIRALILRCKALQDENTTLRSGGRDEPRP